MRTLATIRTVATINPIPDADKIETCTLNNLGWVVVVKKGEFKPGDKVVYFEIDSALPTNDPRFEFLRSTSYRSWKNNGVVLKDCFKIKTIKMRGVVSQGLVLSINAFPELASYNDNDDVTRILHVEHFDEINEQFDKSLVSGEIKGTYPSWIPKSDQNRIQNLPEYFDLYKDVEFTAEAKYDGSSCTVYYVDKKWDDDQFNVCTRNNKLKRPTKENNSTYWIPIIRDNIEEKFKNYFEKTKRSLAYQGELVGPRVNGNRDNYAEYHWFIYDIYDVDNHTYLDEQERHKILNDIGIIDQVNTLKTNWKVFSDLTTLDKMLAYVDQKTLRGNKLEGVVFKSINHKPYFSFKCINNKYLLSEK